MKKRLLTLDILRFILAISVVSLHFLELFGYSVIVDRNTHLRIFNVPFHHGFLTHAVDIFFVLSGFTMVYSTMKITSTKNFLVKRFARIFPLYWISTIVILPLLVLIPATSSFHKEMSLQYIFDSFLLIPSLQPLMVSVAWTLSFEVVFYIIFAASMQINYARRIEIASTVLIFFTILSLILSEPSRGLGNVLLSDKMMFVEFIAGMYIAKNIQKVQKINCPILLIGVGVLLTYGCYFLPEPFDGDIYRGFIYVVPSVLIIMGAVSIKNPLKNQSIIKKIGDLSYTIYIMHTFTAMGLAYFVYSILKIQTWPLLWMTISVIISVAVAYYVNIIIEKPIYKKIVAKLLEEKT